MKRNKKIKTKIINKIWKVINRTAKNFNFSIKINNIEKLYIYFLFH